MSSNGGAPYGPDEPTSFGLQPPRPPVAVPHPGNPYATPAQAVPEVAPEPVREAVPQQQAHPAQPPHPTGQVHAAQPPHPAGQAHPTAQAQPGQQAPHEPGSGRLIADRYRLLDKLGHGGMGTVWRAKDETVDREVAVKEPRIPDHLPERERANVSERMRREARAAARLDHPAVVNVHDVAVVDGRPWIVMELVRGRSLGAALQEGTLGAREAARIGLEVLGALESAHAAGILHRDVKPDNVLLGRGDRVVLTDFGIAQIEGETNLTDTGGFVGSPEFIAPERVLGQRPGPASDLWSLGVVLYAATEGVSPFRRSNTPATLQSVLNATPAPPNAATGPLAEAINGLLDKDPNRRPDAARVRVLLEQAARPPQPVPTQFAPTQLAPTQGVQRPAPDGAHPGGRALRVGRKGWIGLGAVVVAAAVAAYLLVADPFAGPLPDGWKKTDVKALGATMAVPKGYQKTVPKPDAPKDEHWVQFTDLSGTLWISLSLEKKAEDTTGKIAGTASAEMYEDDAAYKQSGAYGLGMDSDPAPRSDPNDVKYKDRKAARNTVVYSSTDTENPRPRELQVLYYRTASGDMYKLMVGYPGKGDFTERGRAVASTAIANLDIDRL
ncbi:serine/threonine protein kinase [Streptomyces dioscori]|uniref:non-specific serine/threonine protein kinase n=1 Tax=Streptomyces dioscori TaxID=2109333 RepID=A0A2P8QD72_9ACTN|nr:serine/threonine-protein kinase [Streptomyces dioscori]PSM44184.1 serine/threonine protein kinase [Streptomyces dioscori]